MRPDLTHPSSAVLEAMLLLAMMVAGCTPVSVKESSPNHVTIESYMMDLEKAQRLADEECGKYSRRANVVLKANPGEPEREYVFECID